MSFVMLTSVGCAFAQEETQSGNTSPLQFEGQFLASVSDADMLASAYVDGNLGPVEGRDALSIIELKGDPRQWEAIEVEASNSVAGPPASLDVTPDGRFAIVVETWTQRPNNGDQHTFSDLQFGNQIRVFDLSDLKNPVLVQNIITPERPDAVRVNASGDLVAIAFHREGGGKSTPLALYPFKGGRLGSPVFPEIKDWNYERDNLIDIDWHPTSNTLALLSSTGANVRFAHVTEDLELEVFGNIVEVEKLPFRLEFTPDGRHVVANALYWGADIDGYWIEAPRGSLFTVRLNAGESGNQARHAMISTIKTGVSPEGIAVSPDGKWVASTNLERSYLPYGDERITWFSSITLSKLNPDTGVLTKVGDFAYDGILPEAAQFDNSSQYLSVATYDHFNSEKRGGSIDFWRITADPLAPERTILLKTDYSIPVTRGAHSMVISR
jgi:DNA-binding beta-propeller fold protein YncE